MIRGTTPKLEFTLPFDVDQLKETFATFSQNHSVVIDKPLSEYVRDQKTLTVHLSQELHKFVDKGVITQKQYDQIIAG